MGCGMKMYLNWETSVPHVFFKWWTADTPFSTIFTRIKCDNGFIAFFFSLVMIFALCFMFEGIVAFRARYDAYLMDSAIFPVDIHCKRKFTFEQHLMRSGLFALSNGYSLFIMMLFMIYNGYMCLACVAGAFAGHLTFALYMPEEELSKRPRSCCD